MDRSLLTPAEAVLLLAPSGGSGAKCLQAGLLSLLGSGHIAIEPTRSAWRQHMLRVLAGNGEPLPRHLASLKAALAGYRTAPLLTSSQAVHALQKQFGLGFRRFIHDELAPSLALRGLVRHEDRKFLGLVPYRRYRRTPSGEALAAPLARLMEALDDLPRLIAGDPDKARLMARSAGVLLLLSPAARREIPKLKALFEQGRNSDGGGTSFAFSYAADERDEEWETLVELGDFALELDAASFFDSLDAIGDFTGDSDGGSDGGDGGGGD